MDNPRRSLFEWMDLLGVIFTVASAVITERILSTPDPVKKSDIATLSGCVAGLTVVMLYVLIEVRITRRHVMKNGESFQDELAKNERRLTTYLSLNHDIVSHKESVTAVRSLLSPDTRGVDTVRHKFVLRQINEQTYFRVQLDKPGEEDERINLLCDVMKNAEKYVFAYTYAEPDYMVAFWQRPKMSLKKYYDAHEQVINGPGPIQLQRIFVVPEAVMTDAQGFQTLVNVITHLVNLGMEDVFYVSESQAGQKFVTLRRILPTRSFFVADTKFLSEVETDGAGTARGYVAFQASDAETKREEFIALRNLCHRIKPGGRIEQQIRQTLANQ